MKTFEEAIGSIVCECAVEERNEAKARLVDCHERYSSLAREAGENANVKVIMIELGEYARRQNLESALFTAFMHGLIAGVEMEKSEL